LLYVYFAVNYFDEQLFNVVLKRANRFRGFRLLEGIFAHSDFNSLTSTVGGNQAR
jgi:hypothetical protein